METKLKYPLAYKSRLGGILAVHGDNGSGRPTRKLMYTCSICSIDRELYPVMFKTTFNHLQRGTTSCGCSKRPILTEKQYLIKLGRVAKEMGVSVVGLAEPMKGKNTLVSISCPVHGTSKSILSNALHRLESPCKKCSSTLTGYRNRLPEDIIVKRFLKTGRFVQGTTFKRSHDPEEWYINCPLCKVDEYGLAGLCDGVFISNKTSLEKGHIPCRCAMSPRLTKDQLIFKTEKIIGSYERNNNVFRCDRDNDYYIKSSKGEGYSVDFSKINYDFPRAHRDEKPDNLYVVVLSNKDEKFLKVGRTIDLKERFLPYKRIYNLELLSSVKGTHGEIKALERRLLNSLQESKYTPIKYFKGYTECLDYSMAALLTEQYLTEILQEVSNG